MYYPTLYLYCAVRYWALLYFNILFHGVMYCILLCCSVVNYTVLCCTIIPCKIIKPLDSMTHIFNPAVRWIPILIYWPAQPGIHGIGVASVIAFSVCMFYLGYIFSNSTPVYCKAPVTKLQCMWWRFFVES